MYTLVMALAASLAMGNDPVVVSSETEQRLDLSGVWEGTFQTDEGIRSPVTLDDGTLCRRCGGLFILCPFTGIDAGEGRLRLAWGSRGCLGIHRREGGQVVICFREAREGLPTSFRAGDGQHLLILRRVRPRQ